MNYKKLGVSVLITLSAGWIGSIFTTPNIESWYKNVVKPPIAPPNWVFGPVWTILFILMGVALYRVWMKKSLGDKKLNWWWIQLGLNILWSILFFGYRNPGLAMVEIIVLWVAIYKTIVSFGKIDKLASKLLIPYLAWVTFASALNFGVWWLNR